MAKDRHTFICQSCGAVHTRWSGKCDSCGEWNTILEEVVMKETAPEERSRLWKGPGSGGRDPQPVALPDVKTGDNHRIVTTDGELNRMLDAIEK